VIAVGQGVVACLGGWRGDRLFVARGDGPLAPVAELGWIEDRQETPQRRLLLAGGEILVLEPREGHLLLPPLVVRRLDLSGREIGREEGEGVPGPHALYFHARRTAKGRSLVTRCGIDPATGRPAVEAEELSADLPGRARKECSGTPLLAGGAWHYPVRMGGLFRGAERLFRGDPATPQRVDAKLVCAADRRGRPGVWVDGRWARLPGPRLFPAWRAPLGPLVAPLEGGLVVLRREGGLLPGVGAPAVRLPEGIYSALFPRDGGLWALREGIEAPALVAAGL